ncbi:MlaE family ABC transporter permease [Massilia sp. PWRC2]|uniref:MlaE family ABC transporter permease n=1 Tax=Massilia sp. PWRC2 TaxID=2804626 RepID=UPI003CF79E98
MTGFIYTKPERWLTYFGHWLGSWWRLLLLGATALVLALSPSTYTRAHRRATSLQIYLGAWQVLPWFTALAALVSLVVIRIVLVTASSYGLSRFALEMVVRVLVLELIPLAAALFVALRAGLKFNLAAIEPLAADADAAYALGLRRVLVAEVSGNAVSVLTLAMVSSIIVLLLAYLNVYGVSPWGLSDYTRTVGRVFDPLVTLGFVLKTVLFGLAVAVIPAAALVEIARFGRSDGAGATAPTSTMQPGAVRLLFVLFVIEAVSLAVKFV